MSVPRGRSVPRTLNTLYEDHMNFATKGKGIIKLAKHYNNVIAPYFFDIPITQVSLKNTKNKTIPIRAHPHLQYIVYQFFNVDPVHLCVCLYVTDVTSLPQRVLWERDYKVYHNVYSGIESPTCCSGRHGHLYRAIATVTGGLRRQDRRH